MAIPPLIIVVIEVELTGDPVLLDVEVNIMSFFVRLNGGSRSKEIRIGRSDRRQERQSEERRPCGVCCDDDDVTLKNYIFLGWSVQMVMYVCGWM